ncbi:MAG: hypothetical protein Q8L68_00880 [Methylococcales bacterium]|nr:hypothetical protein [Methylococcales bacterium]
MKRNEGESYEDYKTRCNTEQVNNKQYLLGRYVWFSKSGQGKGMTFVKENNAVKR